MQALDFGQTECLKHPKTHPTPAVLLQDTSKTVDLWGCEDAFPLLSSMFSKMLMARSTGSLRVTVITEEKDVP